MKNLILLVLAGSLFSCDVKNRSSFNIIEKFVLGQSQVEETSGLCKCGDNIYTVSDEGNVYQIDSVGEIILEFLILSEMDLEGIACFDDFLYVLDEESGFFVFQVGEKEIEKISFNRILSGSQDSGWEGITISGDLAYLAREDAEYILVYSVSKREVIHEIVLDKKIDSISGMTIGKNHLYLLDRDGGYIHKCDVLGSIKASWRIDTKDSRFEGITLIDEETLEFLVVSDETSEVVKIKITTNE